LPLESLRLLAIAADATLEGAVLACKMAGIHGAIKSMTAGYLTRVGERGAGLSGGQRQPLAVARALLKRPKVLIFDEAVASLDDRSAAQVAHAVNQLRGKVTVLFITHKVPSGLQVDAHVSLE
jgi:subfamily B ATP-binding cassette protein HlyB/CyaB